MHIQLVGPGATNLITGIANAFFDSTPCLFITGQVNTNELKRELLSRQKGFQETDIIELIKPITKYCKQVKIAEDIKYELEKAYYFSTSNRCGPVLLDIPIDIQQKEICVDELKSFVPDNINNDINYQKIINIILENIKLSKRPVIIAGNGINLSDCRGKFRKLITKLKIPIVTSMIAVDIIEEKNHFNYGFLGTYGNRCANLIVEKSDLIISIGTRLDCRQTGSNNKKFANNAKLIRIDIDKDELTNNIKENEIDLVSDIREIIALINEDDRFNNLGNEYIEWVNICDKIKYELKNIDNQEINDIIEIISNQVEDNMVITTDVGQNQIWVAQSFKIKPNQRILFSGGHGAMGYSLPAAIGAYYASGNPVISFNGDGGLQMNIQELQFIKRENIPIKIIVLNNHSLGMIRYFQEEYFNFRYNQTISENGYNTPDFCKIADAHGIRNINITNIDKVKDLSGVLRDEFPILININLEQNTYAYPKSIMNKPIYEQLPGMDRNLLNKILNY